MNYRQCLGYLYSLQKFGIKLGLSNSARLLNYLGNPHLRYPTVHIAGTNGKGSVCAILESILCAGGLRTGLYTSPHLVSFSERVRISRKEIEPEFIAEFVNYLRPRIDRDQYTFFEVTTALALLYFAEQKVDFAVIETGLGGRLDSTNLVQPEVAGITNIALEHTDILGKTLRKIAFEKGGIIKKGVSTVTGVVNKEVKRFLRQVCQKKDSRFIAVQDTSNWKIEKLSLGGCQFSARVENQKYSQLFVNLAGRHQVTNAVFALNVAEELRLKSWKLSQAAVRKGLKSVFWPARFQVWRKKPLVILDAAHNPSGLEILVQALADLLPERKVNFVFGVMSDKDYSSMLKLLAPLAKEMTFVQPQGERAARLSDLSRVAKKLKMNCSTADSVQEGYRQVLKSSAREDIICVTGSHYTLGEVLSSSSTRKNK